jgi:hypothetical protein
VYPSTDVTEVSARVELTVCSKYTFRYMPVAPLSAMTRKRREFRLTFAFVPVFLATRSSANTDRESFVSFVSREFRIVLFMVKVGSFTTI